MPWCPNCKNEYVEGITICADCGTPLVSSLEEETPEEDSKQSEAPAQEEIAALKEALLNAANREKSRLNAATPVYEEAGQKAESYRSGGITLLLVGVIGLIFVALCMAGVLPIRLSGAGGLLTGCVMGLLFLVFVILGISSFRSSGGYLKKAEEESALREEMTRWAGENLDAESIDAALAPLPDEPEEQYFKRSAYMSEQISGRFMNLDPSYLDHFVDTLYETLYPDA